MGKNNGEERPLISVIVPVYNAFELLPRCVESIQAQTYKNLEIILIDDGSDDGSSELCDSYASKDMRIHAVHQPNTGVSAARNKGLDMAQGEWIGFVDADDWIESEMFERLLGAALESGKQVSVCGHVKQYPGDWYENRSFPDIAGVLTRERSLECVIDDDYFEGSLWNKLFKRELVSADRAFYLDEDVHVCEDLLFCIQVFLRTDGICYIPDILYHYCLTESGVMMSFSEKRLSELRAWQEIFKLVAPVSKKLVKTGKRRCAEYLINALYMAVRNDRHEYIRTIRREAFRYAASYFFAYEVALKMKARNAAILFFPVFSNRMWIRIKRKYSISWYKEVDRIRQ